MGSSFHMTGRVREVILALSEVLDARVALWDGETGQLHRWRAPFGTGSALEWQTVPSAMMLDATAEHCRMTTTVNERWTLSVWRRPFLHGNVRQLTAWAAELLKSELPLRGDDETFRPPSGGGSPSGSAELDIPVGWARKSRD